MGVGELLWDLLGNWSGTEQQHPSALGPGARTRAMMTFKQDLGGAAVVSDYRQVREDADELLAHSVILVDPERPGSVLWWLFDSVGHPPEAARGTWVDGRLALVRTTPRGSAHHQFSLEGALLSYAVDLELTGQTRAPFLRGRYERLSGH